MDGLSFILDFISRLRAVRFTLGGVGFNLFDFLIGAGIVDILIHLFFGYKEVEQK